MRDASFDSHTQVSKVVVWASATGILIFTYQPNDIFWKIVAIQCMILGDFLALLKQVWNVGLEYLSIGQIGYKIIGIIIGNSNDEYASTIINILFCTSMNLGTFTCIVSFSLWNWSDQSLIIK